MRALSLRSGLFMNRVAVSAMSTSRMWCATGKNTEEKPEEPISSDAMKKLEKELEESKKTIDELKKEILYRAADAENARRIGREDVDKAKLYGISSFGKDMLEVADTLEKGVEAFATIPEEQMKENKALNSICTGVKLSIKVLQKNMTKHGIEKMNVTVGTPFDPNFHDALARTPVTEQAPADTVSHVMKDGYTIKKRILRAAQVGVAFQE